MILRFIVDCIHRYSFRNLFSYPVPISGLRGSRSQNPPLRPASTTIDHLLLLWLVGGVEGPAKALGVGLRGANDREYYLARGRGNVVNLSMKLVITLSERLQEVAGGLRGRLGASRQPLGKFTRIQS